MFFNLNNYCYFIKGNIKGVIYHLGSGDIVRLSAEESDSMLNAEKGEIDEEVSIFKELVAMNWGFFSPKRYFVDKVRPYNGMLLTRPDLKPPLLGVAFLQLTSKCSSTSENCAKNFCAPCRTNDSEMEFMSLDNWKQIIDDLSVKGVGSLIITGGDVTLYDGLSEIIDYILKKKITFSVVLNPFARNIDIINSDIPVIVYSCGVEDIHFIVEKFDRFRSVNLIFNTPVSPEDKILLEATQFKITYSSSDFLITKESITPCDIDKFFRKKNFNNCLCGKIFINYKGDVIPCLQAENVCVGNVLKENLSDVYKRLILTYWNEKYIKPKCTACEWYHGCPVCMFVDPNDKCQYNIEKAEWI